MADYICIDGGTTNTRISLVCDQQVNDTVKLAIGAGSAENHQVLSQHIRDGIATLLARNGLAIENIKKILASGMITSERGLCNLPHIAAPASLQALHSNMAEIPFPHIARCPFVFIPGVKLNGDTADTADMMRGEETELMGLYTGEGLYVLSGSHTKLIKMGADKSIRSFRTMLTGEMLAALAKNTILKDAVILDDYPTDPEYLQEGYQYALQYGLNEALFKVRVLKNLFSKTPSQLYHFFLGAVLSQEIHAIVRYNPSHIILGGQKAIQSALAVLLPQILTTRITVIPPEVAAQAAPLGMVQIYEYNE